MGWPGLITLGALVQMLIIIAMRHSGINFWKLLPLTIVMQWLFMTAYASKESPFTLIWFSAAGVTTVVALLMGFLLFQDRLSQLQVLGLIFISVGILLARIH